MFRLGDKAMLAHLHIGKYGGRKEDKEVTKFVEDTFNVVGVGRWNKKLIPARLAMINSHEQKARALHNFYTVPWDLAGVGILSNELYFEYLEKMQPVKDSFFMEVQRLVSDYQEVLNSEQIRLGPHFKESDYPPQWKLAERFNFSISFYPIPEKGDIRVELVDYELDKLNQDLEKKVRSLLADDTKELWGRINEAVGDLVERLNAERGMRYDSPVIDNLKKLAKVLPSLNFTQDPDLDQMTKDIEDKLTKFKPEEIRDDEVIKNQVKDEADKIAERIRQFI